MRQAHTEKVTLAKIAAREADKQRLANLVTQPHIMALGTAIAGMYVCEKIKWSEDEGRNQRLRAAALAMVMYQSLSMAGAKGWPAAAAALAGGLGLGASGGGTAWSPLQSGEAALLGAGIGSVVPGVGTVIGAGVGLGIDTVYQWVT